MGRPFTDLSEHRFGKLTVLSHAGSRRPRDSSQMAIVYWLCKCECGTEKLIAARDLNDGTKSCGADGCTQRGTRRIDLSNQRFGKLLVLGSYKKIRQRNSKSSDTYWLCRCDCGTEKWIDAGHLRRKHEPTLSCGQKGCGQGGPPQIYPNQQTSDRASYYRNREQKLAHKRKRHRELFPVPRKTGPIPSGLSKPELKRLWRDRNRAKVRAMNSARKKLIKKATPWWADMAAIEQIYIACPERHHVDHIVPIRGLTVEGYRISGLHVPWNLQHLSEPENIGKHTRMRPHEQLLCETYTGLLYCDA